MVETKTCRECGIEKPLEEFPVQRSGKLGRHPLCKACRSAQERARYWRDREAILERSRIDAKRHRRLRWRALQRKYGLSEHDYRSLVVSQRGCCAICERRLPLVVDHDHGDGQVRGLLCSNCNLAIGELDDDPLLCEAAARFLECNP